MKTDGNSLIVVCLDSTLIYRHELDIYLCIGVGTCEIDCGLFGQYTFDFIDMN